MRAESWEMQVDIEVTPESSMLVSDSIPSRAEITGISVMLSAQAARMRVSYRGVTVSGKVHERLTHYRYSLGHSPQEVEELFESLLPDDPTMVRIMLDLMPGARSRDRAEREGVA